MFDPFLNCRTPWTQAQLEDELRRLQEELIATQRIVSASAGDTAVGMAVGTPTVTSIEAAIERILRKLNALDPACYPADSISRVDRTRVTF